MPSKGKEIYFPETYLEKSVRGEGRELKDSLTLRKTWVGGGTDLEKSGKAKRPAE